MQQQQNLVPKLPNLHKSKTTTLEQIKHDHRKFIRYEKKELNKSNQNLLNPEQSFTSIEKSDLKKLSNEDSQESSLNDQSQSSIKSVKDMEMVKYANDMVHLITTEDDKWNYKHMEMLADQIETKLLKIGIQGDREHTLRFLEELRREATSPNKTDDQKFRTIQDLYGIFRKMYKAFKLEKQAAGSFERALLTLEQGTLTTFKSGLLSRSSWIMIGFFYLADSGLLYRKFKQGKVTKIEFLKQLKASSVSTVGGAVIGAAGSTIGFALGTLVFPGVGSAVGALSGGLVGGYYGGHFVLKFYEKLDGRIELAKKAKNGEIDIKQYNNKCGIGSGLCLA